MPLVPHIKFQNAVPPHIHCVLSFFFTFRHSCIHTPRVNSKKFSNSIGPQELVRQGITLEGDQRSIRGTYLGLTRVGHMQHMCPVHCTISLGLLVIFIYSFNKSNQKLIHPVEKFKRLQIILAQCSKKGLKDEGIRLLSIR